MLRKENGITLVALVITIIVLLILAAVTLSLVIGDNGLFTKAKNSGTAMDIATAKEKIALAVADAQADVYSKNATYDDVDAVITAVNTSLSTSGETYSIDTTASGSYYKVKNGANAVKDVNGHELAVNLSVANNVIKIEAWQNDVTSTTPAATSTSTSTSTSE